MPREQEVEVLHAEIVRLQTERAELVRALRKIVKTCDRAGKLKSNPARAEALWALLMCARSIAQAAAAKQEGL